jgi:hypothetical protein
MKLISLSLTALLLAASIPNRALADYVVPATANIFGSGTNVNPAPAGNGGGTSPIQVSLTLTPGTVLHFSASGTISQFPGYNFGADGLLWDPAPSVSSWGGISGYHSDTQIGLVGVFLSNSNPFDPAPATLDFTSTGLGRNFLTLSPLLGQEFFIGDGHTDGLLLQDFIVPTGATRLYLGFADAQNSGQGVPGHYADNSGFLNVAVAVPEPSAAVLIIAGLAALGAKRYRKA